MLNIPTAKPKAPTAATQPEVPGATSLSAAPTTALSQTTPYEYAGQGWNDPVAQQVMQKYYEDPSHGSAGVNAWNPGGGTGFYERSLSNAQMPHQGTQYNTPLSPESWGSVYRGGDYDKIAEDYKAAGGTYYDQFTPAQQAGVPYYAATGEPAPVMNMATGVAENPLTKQPMPVGGTGSFNTLAPDVINRMWR